VQLEYMFGKYHCLKLQSLCCLSS